MPHIPAAHYPSALAGRAPQSPRPGHIGLNPQVKISEIIAPGEEEPEAVVGGRATPLATV